MPRTIVAFHAHPDDEALLSGGTLALLAAGGHRVVLVLATSGAAGLAAPSPSLSPSSALSPSASPAGSGPDALAARRIAEVERSARELGCSAVIHLDYPDSGWTDSGRGPVPIGSFADLDLDVTAGRLAEILTAERADVLMTYDRNGGYGHPDHIRVHQVGIAAAALAATPRIMQVTIDRTQLARAIRLLRLLRLVPEGTATERVPNWFSSRAEITHRISVRAFADRKRAALSCHQSQMEAGNGPRTVTLLLKLPRPLFRRVCGTEWFTEYGVVGQVKPMTDFFAATAREEVSS
jgi:LmbE family N-acetylglucosaminyl deacetylase